MFALLQHVVTTQGLGFLGAGGSYELQLRDRPGTEILGFVFTFQGVQLVHAVHLVGTRVEKVTLRDVISLGDAKVYNWPQQALEWCLGVNFFSTESMLEKISEILFENMATK